MSVPLTGGITITGTAQALSAVQVNATAFTIKAASANAKPVYIGPSGVTAANGYQLDAGDEFEYQVNTQQGAQRMELKVSDFYAVGTAGSDRVSWLASP